MTGRIFINHRHNDSPGTAGRLCDHLKEVFGPDSLFIDADIPAGVNFENYLHDQLNECRAFLAVIGPNWLNVCDEYGHRRLDDASDWVRLEIASALARDIRVIPVIIDNGLLPKPNDLPSDLQPLVSRQGFSLQNARFDQDFAALADKLREAVAPDQASALTVNDAFIANKAIKSIEQTVRVLIAGKRRGFWALVMAIVTITGILVGALLMTGGGGKLPGLEYQLQDAKATNAEATTPANTNSDDLGKERPAEVKRPTEEATQGIERPVEPRPLVEERIGASGPLLKPGIGSSVKPRGPVVIRPGTVP
jgi:hypothetical protein